MCTDEGVQAAELTVLTVSQLFFHLVRRGSNSHPVGSFVITQMPVYIPVKLVPQSAGFVWNMQQSRTSENVHQINGSSDVMGSSCVFLLII